MSDHRERACQYCGCLLHHEDRCPQKERDDKRNATCCRGCGRPFPDELRARIVALETVLGDVVSCAEEGSFGTVWEGHHDDCECVICACRSVLKESKKGDGHDRG